jgi:hypothetical protein
MVGTGKREDVPRSLPKIVVDSGRIFAIFLGFTMGLLKKMLPSGYLK